MGKKDAHMRACMRVKCKAPTVPEVPLESFQNKRHLWAAWQHVPWPAHLSTAADMDDGVDDASVQQRKNVAHEVAVVAARQCALTEAGVDDTFGGRKSECGNCRR